MSRPGPLRRGRPPRPPLLRWLLYAAGIRLPDRYDDWVFHDLNDRGWAVREVARFVMFPLPLAIGALFLPGPLALRLGTAAILLVGPVFVSAAFVDEFRAYRLRQHGLLPPSGPDPD